MVDRNNKSPTEKSEQKVLNWSFDEVYKVMVAEGLGFNGQAVVRNTADTLDLVSYTDSTYDYLCESAPGTQLASTKWRITRINKTTSNVDYANSANFNCAATDLATVQGAF